MLLAAKLGMLSRRDADCLLYAWASVQISLTVRLERIGVI